MKPKRNEIEIAAKYAQLSIVNAVQLQQSERKDSDYERHSINCERIAVAMYSEMRRCINENKHKLLCQNQQY